VDRALAGVLGPGRFSTDVERVLFALAANRAMDPCSKLAAAEWASLDVHVPGLGAMDEDQAYRAMDLLVEADAQAKYRRRSSSPVRTLLNLEVDLLFFYTTTTYFERDEPERREGLPQRQPPRQGGPVRRGRRGQALHHLPQPGRGRARA